MTKKELNEVKRIITENLQACCKKDYLDYAIAFSIDLDITKELNHKFYKFKK